MGTKQVPGMFDCHKRALPDEPMFTLLARDPSAPFLVMDWATQRRRDIAQGFKPESDMVLVDEAKACALQMIEWRKANDGKWRGKS